MTMIAINLTRAPTMLNIPTILRKWEQEVASITFEDCQHCIKVFDHSAQLVECEEVTSKYSRERQ